MIEVTHLTKQFGAFTAVDDLSFKIQPGDVVGFLGPNGAGKSTTMKMLSGFLAPSSGQIRILDYDIHQDAMAIKQQLGYLPEGAPAYGDMTVAQFLDFIADIRGLVGEDKRTKLNKVIDTVALKDVLDKPIDDLSKGFKRRVGIAQAIVHDPKILILDEPTDGLDPNQKHQVRQLISELAKDKMVIISTHILEEVSAVCNRAMIIAQGKKIFDGTPDELQQLDDSHGIVTVTLDQPELAPTLIEALDEVESVIRQQQHWVVTPSGRGNLCQALWQTFTQHNVQVLGFHQQQGRLDEIFRRLTSGESVNE